MYARIKTVGQWTTPGRWNNVDATKTIALIIQQTLLPRPTAAGSGITIGRMSLTSLKRHVAMAFPSCEVEQQEQFSSRSAASLPPSPGLTESFGQGA
ncbi:hypothetical protein Vi05172_g1014 [Venturia inaequalis]|nr:hypothetical protein Vi05172_g1014 [Venturia inaequalis]